MNNQQKLLEHSQKNNRTSLMPNQKAIQLVTFSVTFSVQLVTFQMVSYINFPF